MDILELEKIFRKNKKTRASFILAIVILLLSSCFTLNAAIPQNRISLDVQLEDYFLRAKDSLRLIREKRYWVEQTKRDLRIKIDENNRRAQEQRMKTQDTIRKLKAFQDEQRRKVRDYRVR